MKILMQQPIFVLVPFSFDFLICIFLLHPILLYSGGPDYSANCQTSFLWSQWLGSGPGSWPRVVWDLSRPDPLGILAGVQIRWFLEDLALLTPGQRGACAEPADCGLLSNRTFEQFLAHFSVLNPSTSMRTGICTEKWHTDGENRLWAGFRAGVRALSLSDQNTRGDLQAINTSDSTNKYQSQVSSAHFQRSAFLQLNIGCTNQYSSSAPVLLQYSHDAGLFWSLVKEGCYPASPGTKGCEGSSRELSEPSVYHTGDFEDWTRITIVIPRSLAARYCTS